MKMDMPTLLSLVDADPAINISSHTWIANQRLTWKNLQDYFHSNEDAYLSEMEATDRKGPGSLELKPRMQLPEHVSHQIHIQPGGYVGDPFAGHMYHYGTNSFYLGDADTTIRIRFIAVWPTTFPCPKTARCGASSITAAASASSPWP